MNAGNWSVMLLAAALAAGGCQTTLESSSQAGTSADVAGDRGAAVDPGSDYRRERDRIAMRGLHYDSGRVHLDESVARELVPRPDPSLAVVERSEGLRQLMELNDRHAAIAALTRAVIHNPGDPNSYEALGRALLYKGKIAESESAFRTALDLDPKFHEARFQLGQMLQMSGRNAEAVEQWLAVVAGDPQHAKAHERLAIELYFAGRYEESWRHVHSAERLGQGLPAQFRPLLAAQMSEPVRP